MALEKQLADTDSIYCTRLVNSNQTGIFISNLGEEELDVLFGPNYQSDDEVRLRLNKRNLAFNAVAHVIDGRRWYRRRTNELWTIDRAWLNSRLRTLEEVFTNDDEVFIVTLNKDELSTRRLYMKGLASLTRINGHATFALRDFLFSGDVIVLTKLDNGDVSFEIRIPNNPITEFNINENLATDFTISYQKIIYGAPGTGKSHIINERAAILQDDYKERVTFYPTYTYQQFVGAYKPSVEPDNNGGRQITYSFVPGPFLRLLIKAYLNPDQNHLLIIEELNRANAASVFGDTFQLLDRTSEDGTSEYPVALSEDMKRYFKDFDSKPDNAALNNPLKEATVNYTKLFLPSNFLIWATMNSADQGVFPIDTAFKRRWDFEYLGIDSNEDKISGKTFKFKDGWYAWNTVRKTINNALLARGINEDKQLGPFFLKLETVNGSNEQFLDAFKSKVLMYLFEDAARHCRSNIFNTAISPLSYSNICKTLDEEGLGKVFRFIEEANIVVPNNDGGQDNE